MVVGSESDADVDRIFHALADRTRREILAAVLTEEKSVSTLARDHPMSFAAVQKHIAVLEQAGVVGKRRQGREQLVHARIETLRRVVALLEEYEAVWRQRVRQIDDLLTDEKGLS